MLLFMDGMAHYDTTGIELKYTTVNATHCDWTVAAEGRFGNCLKRVSTSNDVASLGYLGIAPLTTRLGVWSPTTGGVCGFAIKIDDLTDVGTPSTSVHPYGFFLVMEGSSVHVKVDLNATGTFTLRASHDTFDVILAESSEGLTSGAWHYVEFKWLLHSSTGTFEIRVNGVAVMVFTGNVYEQQFTFGSLGVWSSVQLLKVSSTVAPYLTMRICDLYLADLASTLGDDVDDFLGDGIIETIMPNGAGSTTGWTANTGTNWEATNDLPAADDDTTYVTGSAVSTTDLYHFEDVPTGAIIKGVHVNILARKETEGGSSLAPVVHPTSVDYLGPTQGVANVTYDRYITQAWDLNPETGVRFTAAEINAGQFGVQKMV